MKNEITTAITSYMDIIKKSYRGFHGRAASSKISSEMIENFDKGVSFTVGKKYIKVVNGGSVHSFIVVGNDKKFKYGDVLKAASWNAPARNFARGNIFDKETVANTYWTGA